MALVDLWNRSREQLEDKQIHQIIRFAGVGRLLDGQQTSTEYRDYLSIVPSGLLERYSNECLSTSFEGSGFALQDIINEVGRRLGFAVTFGRYRGVTGQIGYDGIWKSIDGHIIIVEIKTTDAYRIDLDTIARYRRGVVQSHNGSIEQSSILIVVGREDTGGLEAQVRGSRHAWDIRLISVDALHRLVAIKQSVDNPLVIKQIHDILIPHEFTKVDRIVEIVFAAAEDVGQSAAAAEGEPDEGLQTVPVPADAPHRERRLAARFQEDCIERIQRRLDSPLLKRSRTTYSSPGLDLVVSCAVSREYEETDGLGYWYAFKPHQRDSLAQASKGFVSFGCGSGGKVLLIPYGEFEQWLESMNVTEGSGRFHWHVNIQHRQGQFLLRLKKGHAPVDLTKYLL